MAKLPASSSPVFPITSHERGARRERVFFGDDDYELYRDLLASRRRKHGVACWATCLMPNPVHLILVPDREEALARALGETHRRYSSVINARLRVTGHLFQSRFGSVAMDEPRRGGAHCRFEPGPRMGSSPARKSGAGRALGAHLDRRDDGLVAVAPLIERSAGRFADWIETAAAPEALSALKRGRIRSVFGLRS